MIKKNLLVVIFIGVLFAITMYSECHYIKKAVVIAVNDTAVAVRDSSGNEWEFYGEGYAIGQRVKLNMFTNFTDGYQQDDIIKGVK